MIRIEDLEGNIEGKCNGDDYWHQTVPSHADHAQYGVARLVQQIRCPRCFGDAEAAVSHRLGYSNT